MADEDEGLDGGQEGNEGNEGNEGGGEDRSWIPEDLREEPSLKVIKNVPALAKSFVEAQKLIGARDEGSVKLPGEDATPEELAEFYGKMGRPETSAGYNLTTPDDLPEGMQWDDGMVEWFGNAAHAAGLSQAQANGLMKAYNDQQYAIGHEGQKALGTEMKALQDHWGDDFKGNVELGTRSLERLLPQEDVQGLKTLLDTSGIGNNPLMLKYAYQVGKMLKEDGYIMSDGHGGVLGADAAKTEIAAINEDKSHAHWNPEDPGHKAAVERMAELFRTAYTT